MNLIIPESLKGKLAAALGFASLQDAVRAVETMPLNADGYAEIRKGGAFIQRTSNRRSYARILCGGGKCGMSQDWAPASEYLTERGVKISKGIPA